PLKVAAAVRDFAVMNGFEGDILFDIGIATAAIVENAIKYGGGGDLIARCDGTAVQVEVRDRGPGLSADVVESPPAGGGLQRAQAAMNEFRVSSAPGNTRVFMRKLK
ncbi:MAG: ATP-binding protein, partial [Planctomycetota bacterium]